MPQNDRERQYGSAQYAAPENTLADDPQYDPRGPQSSANFSSQAGLASVAGGQSIPSSPAPGEPGSRFNPVVRERSTGDVPIYGPKDTSGPSYDPKTGRVPIYGPRSGQAPTPDVQTSPVPGFSSVIDAVENSAQRSDNPKPQVQPSQEPASRGYTPSIEIETPEGEQEGQYGR